MTLEERKRRIIFVTSRNIQISPSINDGSIYFHLSQHAEIENKPRTLKIEKICFSRKVSIQPCWPKTYSALPGGI